MTAHSMTAGFPQADQRKREQKRSHSVFYNLLSEVTYHHFCCVLWSHRLILAQYGRGLCKDMNIGVGGDGSWKLTTAVFQPNINLLILQEYQWRSMIQNFPMVASTMGRKGKYSEVGWRAWRYGPAKRDRSLGYLSRKFVRQKFWILADWHDSDFAKKGI